MAARLRGFGPVGILAILLIAAGQVVPPLSVVLVLAWTKLSRTPWKEIGYVRPKSWTGDLITGIGLGTLLKLLLKVVVMPSLGADPINHAFHYLVGNQAGAARLAVAVVIIAGFGEETVFRGYSFERLGKLLGQGRGAKIWTVLLTCALFGSIHFEQGLAGVEQAIIVGLVFGSIFAAAGRLWMVMCAHPAFDLTAIAIIYWDLESAFAHVIFN